VRAVDVRDLFRIFSTPEGDAAALQGLTLAVEEAELLVVLGPSGSGKTTLLRILAGLERPSAGVVRVLGADLARLPPRRLSAYRAETLGYADQHYGRALAAELPARELVGLQLGLAGAPRRERLRRADELLERVGLAEKGGTRPGELSGGEQQRVAVCAALAHRPRLLLADEPTGELDATSAALVYEVIADLARAERCTSVVVSHDPGSAAIADRIVHVRDGRLAGEQDVRAAAGEEAIVVGRGGWIRLPEEYLRRTGIGARAVARLSGDGIVVAAAAAAGANGAAPVEAAAVPLRDTVSRGEGAVAEVRGLARSFRRTRVFGGLDARFAAGSFVVVTGPSGSGKTTFLRLLAGLDLPDAGEVEVLGTRVDRLDREGRAGLRRERIGFVAQEPGLVPFLSARENVELALDLRGRPRDGALPVLASVGLAELAEQLAGRLSAGERQRVAVARALAARPALLLADEPTARLDAANALAVGVLFAGLARELGTAIVCATHDPLVIEQADEELAL
jgi:ABC-type lipoprotein export system ATPase subunit